MDPIHIWLLIKNSFVSMKISPTNLIFELIINSNPILLSKEISSDELECRQKNF